MKNTNPYTGLAGHLPTPWLELLAGLANLQQGLQTLTHCLLNALPVLGMEQLRQPDYFLPVTTLMHILERQCSKPGSRAGAGQFSLELPDILCLLRDAGKLPARSIPGSGCKRRVLQAHRIIGKDRAGKRTKWVTVITGVGGEIVEVGVGKG